MNGSERLRLFLKAIGKTQKEFADEIGVAQGTVSDIVRGKTNGLSETAAKLCQFLYNANPTWLLTGEGEMFLDESSSPNVESEEFDRETMESVIRIVTGMLQKEGLEMKPDKFAKFILFMYDRHKDNKGDVTENEIKDNIIMLKKFA